MIREIREIRGIRKEESRNGFSKEFLERHGKFSGQFAGPFVGSDF